MILSNLSLCRADKKLSKFDKLNGFGNSGTVFHKSFKLAVINIDSVSLNETTIIIEEKKNQTCSSIHKVCQLFVGWSTHSHLIIMRWGQTDLVSIWPVIGFLLNSTCTNIFGYAYANYQ